MKYSLRSLMIAALVGPPLLGGLYFFVEGDLTTMATLLFIAGTVSFMLVTTGTPSAPAPNPPKE